MHKAPLTLLRAEKIKFRDGKTVPPSIRVKILCSELKNPNRYNSEHAVSIQGFFKDELNGII